MHLLRLLLCCSLWVSGQALAQAPTSPATAPVTSAKEVELEQGTVVQVRKPDLTLAGRFLRAEDSAMVLETDSGQLSKVLLSEVQELSARDDYALEAFLVAGGVGTVLGGMIGGAISDSAENSTGDVVGSAVFGAGLGAALFGGLGALIGWPIEEWDTLYESREGSLSLRPLPEGARRGPWGEVGLYGGYARNVRTSGNPERSGAGSNKNGFDGRLHVLKFIGPYVAVGPELAYTNFGASRFQGGALLRIAGPPDTLPVGVVAGANLGPALVYFAGVTAEHRFTQGLPPLAIELRYNASEHSGEDDYLTLSAGTQLRW